MTGHLGEARVAMPPRRPLAFEAQSLRGAIHRETGARHRQPVLWRALVFGTALGGTFILVTLLKGLFAEDGLNGLELALLTIIALTFIWVAISVMTVAAALLSRLRTHAVAAPMSKPKQSMTTALLVPIYNEDPGDVFGNAAAMLADLARQRSDAEFTLFILSDTRDETIAEQEWAAFQWLCRSAPEGVCVHYRRRETNSDKKTGNIADWIRGWGAGYEAMLVLDADSLMSGRAICQLAVALRDDPSSGLIQSFPALIGAETFFGRVQQFSNAAYGWLLAEGLALWAENEGNYWGHNAIMRTRAFASAAGLPRLRSWGGREQLILSHDFVEAGLIRRAGWSVRFLPDVRESFEETPATLVDYVVRDRRWCQGNIQHLRLLRTSGLHPISRFHLLHGAMGYLMSPAWLALLIVWATLGLGEMAQPGYFSEANPLYPIWPEMSTSQSIAFLLFMYGMLLLPKVTAMAMIAANGRARALYGGGPALFAGFGFEVVASILYAPVMMVQQSLAVIRSFTGRQAAWAPQRREVRAQPISELLRFHAAETVLGTLLTVGLLTGVVSFWLLPIAISLTLAVPLSVLSGVEVSGWRLKGGRLETPQSLFAPPIWHRAQEARAEVRAHLARPDAMAAE